MGWESFGVVRFDLGPLLHGQRFGMVNQPVGNHGPGIFWCGRISPWTPPSRSNEDSQT